MEKIIRTETHCAQLLLEKFEKGILISITTDELTPHARHEYKLCRNNYELYGYLCHTLPNTASENLTNIGDQLTVEVRLFKAKN